MNSDKDNSQLPVTSDSSRAPVTEGSEIQYYTGVLPPGDSIRLDEKLAIARTEGFHPMAIELAVGSDETATAHKFLQLGLVIIAAILVAFLFPFDRFFKPPAQVLGTMSIGDPVSGTMSESNQPWLQALQEMDQLYFREGKLTEAIQVAERYLATVPEADWESWRRVHYRYWELLADAGKTRALKAATRSYLKHLPEDPFANYYAAHALLAAAEPMRSFGGDMRQDFRLEAEALAGQIERAEKALRARQKAERSPEQKDALTHFYQKLRLQQARLLVLIWRLGGYREDKHPDVVYRDKALKILEQDGLINLEEAKILKIAIYNHILDRWYWFEGQQVIHGMKQRRKALAAELKQLQQELKRKEAP